MGVEDIWQATLGELELTLSKANFTTWFKNTFISKRDETSVVIGVPNTFTKAWLEKKYHSSILKALQKITDNKIRAISYRVETKPKGQVRLTSEEVPTQAVQTPNVSSEQAVPQSHEAQLQSNRYGLNPKYSFSNFVIGKGNELAHAAALAVTQKLGQAYNPLFIYGGVGLGKTHLMQAVGQQVLASRADAQVLYVSCEKFTNDFIKSISSNRIEKFKEVYRSVDVLLIDDIQFLAGKEGIQEAFFHTFNDLHQANKQIVLTSDRPPKAIPALEQRLISRFEWGMLADISMPDMETRTAILRSKLKERKYELHPEIVSHIATSIQNNVRELEGALNKIVAHHELKGQKPTLESVKSILSSLSSIQHRRSLTPKQIIQTVGEFYDVSHEDLLGNCRKKNLAQPRQIVMFLMREELKTSYPAIGHEVGNRDHTTAIHAFTKISQLLDSDEKIIQDVKLIREKLYN